MSNKLIIMKVKDWNILCDTIGKQMNLILLCGMIATVDYYIAKLLEELGIKSFFVTTSKGVSLFLAAYFFVYCLILVKKFIDKYYR